MIFDAFVPEVVTKVFDKPRCYFAQKIPLELARLTTLDVDCHGLARGLGGLFETLLNCFQRIFEGFFWCVSLLVGTT